MDYGMEGAKYGISFGTALAIARHLRTNGSAARKFRVQPANDRRAAIFEIENRDGFP